MLRASRLIASLRAIQTAASTMSAKPSISIKAADCRICKTSSSSPSVPHSIGATNARRIKREQLACSLYVAQGIRASRSRLYRSCLTLTEQHPSHPTTGNSSWLSES